MTYKGFCVLESILQNGLNKYIDLIIIGKDASVQKDYSDEIKELCERHLIDHAFNNEKLEVRTIYCIAISWRWLINLQDRRLIVLHDSILPKYRGFAPLVAQLINGEERIGVTALFATNEYDKGPVICCSSINVSYPIFIQQAIEKLSKRYCLLVNRIIKQIALDESKLKSKPQDEKKATYSLWREKEDYRIDWNWPAAQLIRFINAVGFPYDGAFTMLDKTKIRILSAEEFSDVAIENRHPGKVIFIDNNYPIIVCGKGLIKLKNAIFDENKESIFPLKNFRTRFR